MIDPTAQSVPPGLKLRPRGIRIRQLISHLQSNIAVASGLLFVVGLALRLYRLGAQSLWLDEGGTWAEVIGQGWGKLVADLWSADAAYPLYHLLLKGWVALAGDSEWALRFPSALAGAAAVVAVFLAALELQRYGSADNALSMSPGSEPPRTLQPRQAGHNSRPSGILAVNQKGITGPLLAPLLFMLAPFAVWHAQDAKVYSLLLLCAAALLWALLRALRVGSARAWYAVLAVAFVSIFVHRLAILGVVGALLAVGLAWPFSASAAAPIRRRLAIARGALLLVALCGAAVAIYGLVRAVGVESRGGTGHIPAGPFAGLWLTVAHFALDRGNIGGWLGVPLLVWALPALVLTCWGLGLAARDARRGDAAALVVLALFAVPLLLFAAALAFVRLFEARYVTVAFPAWILLLALPLQSGERSSLGRGASGTKRSRREAIGFSILNSQFSIRTLGALVLLVDVAVLWQPQHGLFSGAPVKEQWREGIAEIARRVHPDDLLIVHPYYVAPMWQYYAPRVTPDPLPQPVTFNVLGEGDCLKEAVPVECYRKRYEKDFDDQARGHKRMLMLIAPDHARTIDPPKEGDRFGVLGLRFQFAKEQRTWPCGDTNDALIGVEVMCASFPSFYRESGPAAIPQPRVGLAAVFGGELGLRGYTIDAAGGKFRPGGTLPITLYWAAQAPPTRDYTMFLHLCQDCDMPPDAQFDRPPLDGQFPAGQTSTWLVGDPVHDERAIPLVGPDGRPLAPGRYTLLLGVYPAGLATPQLADRLPVASADAEVRGGTRLVLGEVTIGP